MGLITLAMGIYLGGHPSTLPEPVRDVFVQDSDGELYDEAIDTIERDYYRKVDREDLLNQSLDHAVRSLDDRFSNYFAPRDYADFQQATEGRFEGVGMSVTPVDEGLRIVAVYEGSPAARGGLKKGDLITEVDGKSIAGASSEESTTRIKGPAGTDVKLTVRTGKEDARELTLKRAEVAIPVVQSKMRESGGHKIAWVRLAGFTAGAHDAVKEGVTKLLDDGAEGVVLDLRDNGGGLLNEAVEISSIFIPDGRIVSTRGRARPERVYDATGGAIDSDIPVVVLVNKNSASASEIVTGALQDRDRATVVGTRTFGKGVFQEIEPLSNGGALDITVGEYFLPSGRNLGGGGVERGAGVKPDVEAKDNPKTPRDEALQAALREAQ
ncbi:MAG TPA: S41 family peptidase [Solirubrobacteraceae bacterium]|nr:S41 family peptidase [Solirubrobacteraceae bacterium]